MWVKVLRENKELFENLQNALVDAAVDASELVLPRLFATPGGKKWKGVKIRAQLAEYLRLHGYGYFWWCCLYFWVRLSLFFGEVVFIFW